MINTLKKRFDAVVTNPYIYKLYAFRPRDYRRLKLKYQISDFNPNYYAKVKKLGLRELEHQIGRLSNFQKIVAECAQFDGDFIEFGSWKGFSLLWIAYFMERNAIFTKKLLGLDGFIGLPYADTASGFRVGKFANTSVKECRRNLLQSDELYAETKKNIFVEKFLYSQKNEIVAYLKKRQVNKLCFIHIDCDVSRSAEEIFTILLQEDLLADKAYILFDDYGIEPALKSVVDKFMKDMQSKWTVTVHSETDLTKNFLLTKKHAKKA